MMKYIALMFCAAIVSTNAVFGVQTNDKCKKKKKSYSSSVVYDSCDECKKKGNGGK